MISSLQALRFAAAFLVLLQHTEDRLVGFGDRYGVDVFTVGASGQFGVKIFFVISGFLMVWIASENFGKAGGASRFLWDRLTRVVPMYWIATLLQVAFLVFAASRGDEQAQGNFNLLNMLKSLAFIPYFNIEEKHRPLLEQGWTLNYEIFFYAVFALCLLFPRKIGALLITFGLCLLVIVGSMFQPSNAISQVWTDVYLLDFLCGILLAECRMALIRRQGALPTFNRPLVTLFALIVAAHVAFQHIEHTGYLMTLIATMCVACCVLTRQTNPASSTACLLVRLGDSSYSVYLFHGFVLLAVGIAWRKLFGGEHLVVYELICLFGSLLAGALITRYLEKPVTAALRHRFKTDRIEATTKPRGIPEARSRA